MSEMREEVAPMRSAGPVERVAFVPERGPQRPRRVKRASTPERKFLSIQDRPCFDKCRFSSPTCLDELKPNYATQEIVRPLSDLVNKPLIPSDSRKRQPSDE